MTRESKRHGDTSKNSEFAQMQGAEKISQRRICIDMLARNFFRNAAVGMKSGFLEVSTGKDDDEAC